MIWKECIFPQVITIENDSQEYREPQYPGYQRLYKTVVKAKANFTTPTILHVCKESRDIGLKAYTLELQPQLGHPVYFNWACDTLFMENFDALLAFYGGPWANSPYFGNNMSNIERGLRRLVIGEEIPHGFVPTKVISRLYNLERLTLPRPDGRGFAGENAKKKMKELVLGWMKEKQDLYSEQEKIYKEWALPEIEFLNKKQLADFEKKVSCSDPIFTVNSSDPSGMRKHGVEEITVTGYEDQDDEAQEVLSVEPRRHFESPYSTA